MRPENRKNDDTKIAEKNAQNKKINEKTLTL